MEERCALNQAVRSRELVVRDAGLLPRLTCWSNSVPTRLIRNWSMRSMTCLGDVVCGGFAMPIREGKAQEIYIVCSAVK